MLKSKTLPLQILMWLFMKEQWVDRWQVELESLYSPLNIESEILGFVTATLVMVSVNLPRKK